jgi:hypothetical protein
MAHSFPSLLQTWLKARRELGSLLEASVGANIRFSEGSRMNNLMREHS